MDAVIVKHLSGLEFGEPQCLKNMEVLPLFVAVKDSLEYLTLDEALGKKLLHVTEVGAGGTVPNLKVANRAKVPVLVLDGEELAGGMQNRVLNTTILLKENSDTVVPVSCTEAGRWRYTAEKFAGLETMISPRLRKTKVRSVSRSLRESGSFESDQGAVWNDVETMLAFSGVDSETKAMRAAFEGKRSDLQSYAKAFQYVPGQKGLLVLINGEVAGFDVVSLESAYEKLHPKMVQGYAMDALLDMNEKKATRSAEKAKAFVERAKACNESRHESVGYGRDYRFDGDRIVGSALVHRKLVIHAAFFEVTAEGKMVGRMAGVRRRAGFRM